MGTGLLNVHLFTFYSSRDWKKKVKVLCNGLASSDLNMAVRSLGYCWHINMRQPTQSAWLGEKVFLQSLFPKGKGIVPFKKGNDFYSEAIQGCLGGSVSWMSDSSFRLRSWSQGYGTKPCAKCGGCLRFSFSLPPSLPLSLSPSLPPSLPPLLYPSPQLVLLLSSSP